MDLQGWWGSLPLEARQGLARDPHGAVPGEYASVIAQSNGPLVVGSYWPAVSDGPEGFYFSSDVQDFISSTKTET